MDDPKRSKAAAADGGFPDDPLVEILSRLPVKPLFRFKCVSKGWCHLISDRLGRRKFPQTLEGFFVVGGGVNEWRFINLSGKSVPLVDTSFSFLTKLPGFKDVELLSSHSGLLLFVGVLDCGRCEYIVCNPVTEQWMRVPIPGTAPCSLAEFACGVEYFLIFDPAVSSQFHLLQFRQRWSGGFCSFSSVHVFSSDTRIWRDRTRGWRQWGEVPSFGGRGEVWSKLGCADVNGMLHVPVYQDHSRTKDVRIAMANMEGQKIMSIQWPGLNKFAAAAFIGQSQGHLHCITAHRKQEGHLVHITGLSIWVLDYSDDAAQCILEGYDIGQWVLKQSVSCSQLFGEISCGVRDLDVVAIQPDRNLVFFFHHCSSKLISYDMDSDEACDIFTLGRCWRIIPYVPYFADVPVLSGRPSTDFLEVQPTIL